MGLRIDSIKPDSCPGFDMESGQYGAQFVPPDFDWDAHDESLEAEEILYINYTIFMVWRQLLAINADYGNPYQTKSLPGWIIQRTQTRAIDWNTHTDKQLAGFWDESPIDPLMYLLVHSDTDGWLPTQTLEPLARRIYSSIVEMPHGDKNSYRDISLTFAKGCLDAADRGRWLIFA